MSSVEMPGRIILPTARRVSAAIWLAIRMPSTSLTVLMLTLLMSPLTFRTAGAGRRAPSGQGDLEMVTVRPSYRVSSTGSLGEGDGLFHGLGHLGGVRREVPVQLDLRAVRAGEA